MKTRFTIFFLIFLAAATLFAADKTVFIHSGFGTGQDYIKISEFEKQYIADVLESVNGSRNKAAELLGIHRNTLLAKTSELNLK